MPNGIVLKCQHCGHELVLDELLETQLIEKINKEKLPEILRREAALQADVQKFNETKKRENLLFSQALSKKTNAMQLELEKMARELSEMQQKSQTAVQTEVQLRKANQALLQEKENMELEIVKRVEQQLASTRQNAAELVEKKHQLELLDKEKTISDLTTMVEGLTRKLHQGSQQQQGEIGELLVEETLRREFPSDEIQPVPKGVAGADILLEVHDRVGRVAGKLLLEIKRTKSWSSQWIGKMKNDQREARADIAVIISETLPDTGKKKFACMEGVWVCDIFSFREFVAVLRHQLLEVYRIQLTRSNEQTKAADVYDYISGTEFRQTVTAIMDSLKSLRDNLDHEKNVVQKLWSKQEKLIEQISCATLKVEGNVEVLTGSSDDSLLAALTDDIA